ncbi:GntR family transcriptional regulator YhfZ [Calorimonas adulescens]|uniref:GntR family transcriptional regulator YhfZ n=1 Tax=Calorimonas adulescens TaxID=2606906 RepID=UPI001EEFF932|nr:GntR family transcriptional regulator YhfZ [Calorimonas adulescens]
MIDKQLLTKNGIAVLRLARELISLRPGQRIETVGDYADKLDLGRGTIQSALKYLEDSGAVKLDARGHLGTYIESIEYKKLWEVAGLRSITGVMPLPYSRRYEGLATGLYKTFEKADIPFNMAYMRGGYRREEALEQDKYDFAVMSMLAAELNIASGKDMEIAMDFGRYSYVGGHKVLFSNPKNNEIMDGMKVALDSSSVDHFILTCYECEGKQVEYVELSYNQILKSLMDGKIDAAVWNIDEVIDRGLNIPYYDLKNPKIFELNEKDTVAAIVVKKSNWGIGGILKHVIDKDFVMNVQNKVLAGEILPAY